MLEAYIKSFSDKAPSGFKIAISVASFRAIHKISYPHDLNHP